MLLTKRAIKEQRTGRIRLVNQSNVDKKASANRKNDFSKTPPYVLLKTNLELETKGCIHRGKWIEETGFSKRTFARYITKINDYYFSNERKTTGGRMVKSVGKGWYKR